MKAVKIVGGFYLTLTAFAPFAMVIGVLPITSISLVTWSNLFDLIMTFRYEFFSVLYLFFSSVRFIISTIGSG